MATSREIRSTSEFVHEHPHPLPTTPRGHEMAMEFAIDFAALPEPAIASRQPPLPVPMPGEILFLTGASGSGKSSLLRLLTRRVRRRGAVINLRAVRLADRPVLDLFPDPELAAALRRLSAVGLAEVWTWLRRPRELSEGQRWRLRLALALARAERFEVPATLVCDEFCAVLDRVTAWIVAAAVRRAVDAAPGRLCAILATASDDIARPLDADLRVDCDFGSHTLTRRRRRIR